MTGRELALTETTAATLFDPDGRQSQRTLPCLGEGSTPLWAKCLHLADRPQYHSMGRAIEAASTDTYKTMYEAYAAGAAALKELVPMTTKRPSKIRSR